MKYFFSLTSVLASRVALLYTNMNWLTIAVGCTLLVLSYGELYTDRYDNINVDEIIANRRLFVPYIKCILDQGRCTAEGKAIKLHVKDAMQSSCSKCTEFQKVSARKVVNHIKHNEKDYWDQLKKKYDPNDKYKPTYEAFLAAED